MKSSCMGSSCMGSLGAYERIIAHNFLSLTNMSNVLLYVHGGTHLGSKTTPLKNKMLVEQVTYCGPEALYIVDVEEEICCDAAEADGLAAQVRKRCLRQTHAHAKLPSHEPTVMCPT